MALEVARSTEQWIERFGERRRPTVVAIGNFDGMHRGHQEILSRAVELARREDHAAAVLTFYPHPARVLRPAQAPPLLMTLDQRLYAFQAIGVDAALLIEFDAKFAAVSAEEFTRDVLVKAIRMHIVLVGENFRFGYHQMGDVPLLREYGRQWNFRVEVVPPVVQDGVVISSTAIRNAVQAGNVEEAERMLGRPFSLRGEIQSGSGVGRKLVVPTLNLKTELETLPANGVYATETLMSGQAYKSVTNVGMRPTFNGSHLTIESHLLDFREGPTDGEIDVRFLKHLRNEQKFSGPEALKEQVTKDIDQVRAFFAKYKQVPIKQ